MKRNLKEAVDKLNSPEAREFYEERLRYWDEKMKPLIESNRRAQRITGEDLNIRVGPCDDDLIIDDLKQ